MFSFDKEDITKEGEFVCSEFVWLPLEKQKENAEKFVKITNANKKD